MLLLVNMLWTSLWGSLSPRKKTAKDHPVAPCDAELVQLKSTHTHPQPQAELPASNLSVVLAVPQPKTWNVLESDIWHSPKLCRGAGYWLKVCEWSGNGS